MPLFKRTDLLMGNRFDLAVVGSNELDARAALEKAVFEIQRIEQLLSTYRPDSQTNQINEMAGISPVIVDAEVFELIQRAQRISDLTQGAFDLTYGSMDKSLWNFDQKMTQLPSPELAKKSVQLIDYQQVELDIHNKSIFLKKRGMRLGFGGIGKGYAADRAKALLVSLGFQHGLVNASGDLCAWGNKENGKPWSIGVVHPDQSDQIIAHFDLKNSSVATSGNYEKFVVIDGKKYSHTIDPNTGYPIQGIKSVTVFAPFAELADALTTPIAVMGVSIGLDLINQIPGLGCVVIDDDNQVFYSESIKRQQLELLK
ncbi:FAD:protein FMN transferase [Aquirufa nivalisilvae]|uniref:FAD:protein FMN transferase n=1 Tax=Aquirufa nivalisilvae TaxID=2516557 RepID=A0A2S2DUW4_9BACT|nr:FAD:protein FMN transferase [Aquirufa nivalisilvae]AWL09082.1 FAD:protein FMN transferase [Aquirufa nivalisilvae]